MVLKQFIFVCVVIMVSSLSSRAQQTDVAGIDKDTLRNFSSYKRSIHFAGLLQTRWKGLLQLFEGIPIQMYNFHQVAIIRRYLTKKPKMQASK